MSRTQHNRSSTSSQEHASSGQGSEERFWVGLARAFAGALIFAIPLFMTMEMWWLGFYIDRLRLALFMVVNFALLIGLAQVRGFQQNSTWLDSIIDASIGYGVGLVTAAVFLYLFGVVDLAMTWDEIIGKVALQSVPGSIGALLARSQLGGSGGQQAEKQQQQRTPNYGRELFIMVVGALYVAFTIAPTREMILIAYQITPWMALALVFISLVILHAFVYAVNFQGQEQMAEEEGSLRVILRYAVAGYAAVLLVSLYLLWSFGRLGGTGPYPVTMVVVVLSVPGAIGAAAGRLIL